MNFEWMRNHDEMTMLFESCREAEDFVLARPIISAIASRRAMEAVVKEVYQESVNEGGYAETVYEMVSDSAFGSRVNNASIINAIHTVRRTGNTAAHGGSITENAAMESLEALHRLTTWYGMRKGFLERQIGFVPPKHDRIQEILEKMSFDNYTLRIEPYIRLNGDVTWLPVLTNADVLRLINLSETPEVIRTDAFYSFLEQFERCKKQEVEQILELLPLTATTEHEWKRRRECISADLTGEVDAFVQAVNGNSEGRRTLWRKYADTLGDKAGWFLQLTHPEIIPATMRSGFLLPEAQADSDSYIPLQEAVEQMLREIAAGDENKGKLMCNRNWCRDWLGLDVPVLIPKGNNLPLEERQRYSKKALHVGNRKFFYLLEWNKESIYAIRSRSGGVGENIVTIDRMADWGFVDPDSQAAIRARERARLRIEEEARRAELLRKQQDTQRPSPPNKPAPDEISPKEIRARIERILNYTYNARLLAMPEWCKIHIGIDEPVLLSTEEWTRMRRKQQSLGIPLSYSACTVDIGKSTYVVRRMNRNEYETLLVALQELQD